MRVLILGHRGMLGRTLVRYFTEATSYTVITLPTRWGDPDFLPQLLALTPDVIINCIGKIPQKNPSDQEYFSINIELPRSLESIGVPVIHPSTDCEFKGTIAPGETYTKTSVRDADDVYGKSKAAISQEIESSFVNTKIIRTSIIGHEEATAVALLDWFLSQSETVRGYTNHYWNGLTTLEWAKRAQHLIESWDTSPVLNQYGTSAHYSKFDIITTAKEIYQKDIEIIPFETDQTLNKCLLSDTHIPALTEQLEELKAFFKK